MSKMLSCEERREDGVPFLNPKYHVKPYKASPGGKPSGSREWAEQMGARAKDGQGTSHIGKEGQVK